MLIESNCPILAVVSNEGTLVGVVTEWDITRSAALGGAESHPLEEFMCRQVIAADPSDTVLDMIRKLEHHEISAMPVVENGSVLGMVSAELLARRSLLKLLQSQGDR